jgi:hypothetical protein
VKRSRQYHACNGRANPFETAVEARPRYFALYERGFLKVELHPSFTTVIAETAIHSEPTTGLGK